MKIKLILIVLVFTILLIYNNYTCKKVSNPILNNIGKKWYEVSHNNKKVGRIYSIMIFDEKGFYNLKVLGLSTQTDLITDSLKWYYNNNGEIYLQKTNNYRFGSLSRNQFVFYEGINKSVYKCYDCR